MCFRCYASDEHLEGLYSHLVKTSLGREDVANLEKENVKNSHEVKQSFRNASKASKSYLYRTSLELVASVILMIFFLSYGDIKGLARPLFDCDVHSILFKCVIPNSRFYYVSVLNIDESWKDTHKVSFLMLAVMSKSIYVLFTKKERVLVKVSCWKLAN